MKKFGILLLSLCITTPALADFATSCTNSGGTIITANSYGNDKGGLCNDPNNTTLTNNCNGKKFCLSGFSLNWWSSFTWCESIGGKFASIEEACPGSQAVSGTACPNFKGINTGVGCWRLSTGLGTDNAFAVCSNGIGTRDRVTGYRNATLCVEK